MGQNATTTQRAPEAGQDGGRVRIRDWKGVLGGEDRRTRMTTLLALTLISASMTFTQLGFIGLGANGVYFCYVMGLLAPVAVAALLLGKGLGFVEGLLSGLILGLHAYLQPLDIIEQFFVTPLNSIVLYAVVGFMLGLLFAVALRNRPSPGRQIAYVALVCLVVSFFASVAFLLNSLLSIVMQSVRITLQAAGPRRRWTAALDNHPARRGRGPRGDREHGAPDRVRRAPHVRPGGGLRRIRLEPAAPEQRRQDQAPVQVAPDPRPRPRLHGRLGRRVHRHHDAERGRRGRLPGRRAWLPQQPRGGEGRGDRARRCHPGVLVAVRRVSRRRHPKRRPRHRIQWVLARGRDGRLRRGRQGRLLQQPRLPGGRVPHDSLWARRPRDGARPCPERLHATDPLRRPQPGRPA